MINSKGFRTIEDLKAKPNLTRQQTIGLKYHSEFQQRIPRDEVAKIETIVKKFYSMCKNIHIFK